MNAGIVQRVAHRSVVDDGRRTSWCLLIGSLAATVLLYVAALSEIETLLPNPEGSSRADAPVVAKRLEPLQTAAIDRSADGQTSTADAPPDAVAEPVGDERSDVTAASTDAAPVSGPRRDSVAMPRRNGNRSVSTIDRSIAQAALRVATSEITFLPESARLTAGSAAALERVHDILRSNVAPMVSVTVVTREYDSDAGNRALALARARVVVTALVGRGVDPARFEVSGRIPDESARVVQGVRIELGSERG